MSSGPRLLATLKPVDYERRTHSYGALIEIDWETRRVLRHLKLPSPSYRHPQATMLPCPGGVCMAGERVFVAAWNHLVEIDYASFEITNVFSHPLMSDLHGIATDGESLWVVSTAVETLLCFEIETWELRWRFGPDAPILAGGPDDRSWLDRRRHRRPRQFSAGEYRFVNKGASPYHHHHINDVRRHGGHLFLVTKGWNDGERSAVIRLDRDGLSPEFFVAPGGFGGAHDGEHYEGRFIVTESGANGVAWREADGAVARAALSPAPRFVRGLCRSGARFFVGFTPLRGRHEPASIAEYPADFSREVARLEIEGFYPADQGTAIHALHAVDDVNLPDPSYGG